MMVGRLELAIHILIAALFISTGTAFVIGNPLSRIRASNTLQLHNDAHDNNDAPQRLKRSAFLSQMLVFTTLFAPSQAKAAPPISVIAEELGYFPVTNRKGETVMVPKRVKRTSSQQAIDLAVHLQESGAVMYGAYWCPHCSRQKEIFGKEAWDLVPYVECSPKGFNANIRLCSRKKVDGYPTWVVGGKTISGETNLSVLADASNYKGDFVESNEENVPPMLGSQACK